MPPHLDRNLVVPMKNTEYYQVYLSEELARRCERNPRYSTRAFAQALTIDVASVSRILAGKQIPSFKICQVLFDKLEMSPTDQRKFMLSVAARQKADGCKRISPAFKKLHDLDADRVHVSVDTWRVIADWYHGAIMELTFTKSFKPDPKWIAKELGLTEVEAKLALQRLLRLGLLTEKNGRIVKAHSQVSSADKSVTSAAHRRLQRQVLSRAIASLESDPIERRNMTSMAMAIDPAKIPRAKEMIQKFSRELCAFLESGKQTQVYQLGICLYPVSKSKGEQ